jgi:putative transposase
VPTFASGSGIAEHIAIAGTNGHEAIEVHGGLIAFIMRQAEKARQSARSAAKPEAWRPFTIWRKKCTGLIPSEMKRLRQLEEANGKLMKTVADLSLDKAMLRDVIREGF